MIQNERDCRHEHVLGVARQMMTAARTAPKGKGVDVIETALVTGEDLKKLSEKMSAMAEELGMKFFLRDAANVLQAECVVIIGTREQAPRVELRSLWLSNLCRAFRGCAMCLEYG